ncbi:hypothetical protein Dsin_029316 [Dipteronia sinensis]|uniref:PWWP domain-containing protein n=1 Tax=Dipteronia sinensis TaxID=43782 RepID=A0AAD9ZSV8_9ROSI|nr:hypothetical protein Dsin_029316 [Dipteronia sinensis]
MELSFEETRFISNKVCDVDYSGEGGEGGGDISKFGGSRVYINGINCGEQIDCVTEAANMVDDMRNEKLTKGGREMIHDCEKKAKKRFGYRYEVGDLVWGKVRSYPWWPGQIFNEVFALPCVRNGKREGRVLVAFFGDNSYGWFDPIELIPFDINYVEKSKQTNDREFVNAVEEAEGEACRRAALGLLCHCRNPSSFRATGVNGFVEVDVCGYQPGGLYSVKQIKSFRDGFKPVEMLSLLQELASTPYSNMNRSISSIQNVAVVLAYRKAVFEEVDETYALLFRVQPICSTNSASSDVLLTPKGSLCCFPNHKKSALSAGDHVMQRRGPPACIITEFPVGNIGTTPGIGHSGKEATTLKKKSVPEKLSSIKAIVNKAANRVEDCEVSQGFKHSQPRYSKVAKTSRHLKNVKVVGRIAPPSDAVLHGKVLIKGGDNWAEKPAVPKYLGEELHFEEAPTINKKKRKKHLGLEYPHNRLKIAKKESSNGTPNSVSYNLVATEQMADRRITSGKKFRLVGSLFALAVLHNIPLSVLQFFLQYRSTVYENYLVLPSVEETELLEVPTAKSPAFDVDAKSPNNWTSQDLPSSWKPPKKQLKIHDYANVGPNNTSDCGKGASTEEMKKSKNLKPLAAEKKAGDRKLVKKSLGRNERKTNVTVMKKLTKYPSKRPDSPTRATKPTMILMQFHRRSAMPSVSELKARFARFGQIHSAPRVFWKSSKCQVVFKYESDANAAYRYAVESKSLFGNVKVEYFLQALEVLSPQLSKPCKLMITGDSTKQRFRAPQHQLLHPKVQPKSCRKKQPCNELDSTVVVHGKNRHIKVLNSNGGSSSCAAININAKTFPPLPFPPEKIDISAQMLSLLKRCSDIVADLKSSLGYMPRNL